MCWIIILGEIHMLVSATNQQEDILTAINEAHALSDEDKAIAFRIMLKYMNRLQDLNSTFAKQFIKNMLPNLILSEKKRQETVIPTDLPIVDANNNNEKENIEGNSVEPILVPKVLTFKHMANDIKSKEDAAVQKFLKLAKLKPKSIIPPKNRRLNQFVITLGIPQLPRRHSGVDDSYHPDQDISKEWLDLLQRGHNTLNHIANGKKGSVCEHLIFLRGPVTADEDALTKRIHQNHTLDVFKSNIENERQLPVEFHFAGHGNTGSIGARFNDIGMSPEALADMFDQICDLSNLKDDLKSKKQLIFNFHACNSATTELTGKETVDEIKSKFFDESIAGKFYKRMISLGYENIKVMAYRGFYQGMNSSNSSSFQVIDTVKPNPVSYDGMRALHTIERKGKEDIVSIPSGKDSKCATFHVDLDSARPVYRAFI